jgi:hypothetical protein
LFNKKITPSKILKRPLNYFTLNFKTVRYFRTSFDTYKMLKDYYSCSATDSYWPKPSYYLTLWWVWRLCSGTYIRTCQIYHPRRLSSKCYSFLKSYHLDLRERKAKTDYSIWAFKVLSICIPMITKWLLKKNHNENVLIHNNTKSGAVKKFTFQLKPL